MNQVSKRVWLFQFFAIFAQASVLEFQGTPVSTVYASGYDVKIYGTAKLNLGEAETRDLFVTGAGIRKKKLGFLYVNVYVAASYIDTPDGISESDPMETIKATRSKAMQLTLVRDLSANQIRSGFEDALDVNGVDLDMPGIKHILNEITFDMNAGSVVSIIAYSAQVNGRTVDTILIETPQKNIVASGNDLSYHFWKVWFAIPVDDGMKALKPQLMKKPTKP